MLIAKGALTQERMPFIFSNSEDSYKIAYIKTNILSTRVVSWAMSFRQKGCQANCHRILAQ